MKVKLLKIIRKRYLIQHYPNGCFLGGEFRGKPITILFDLKSEYNIEISYLDKKEAYKELYIKLLEWILTDYKSAGKRRNKKINRGIVTEKLWYESR